MREDVNGFTEKFDRENTDGLHVTLPVLVIILESRGAPNMNISIGADIAIFGNIGYWQNLCWQADIFELDLHLVLQYCQYNNLTMPVCHIIKLHGFIGAAILILALVSVADISVIGISVPLLEKLKFDGMLQYV